MDDGLLVDELDTVIGDITAIQTKATSIGLELNASKCEAYLIQRSRAETTESISKLQAFLPGLKILRDDELTLLGAALTEQACPVIFQGKIKALELMYERLGALQSHPALFLLMNCFAIPKVMYTLR